MISPGHWADLDPYGARLSAAAGMAALAYKSPAEIYDALAEWHLDAFDHRGAQGFVASDDRRVVVSLRGTKGCRDVATDAAFLVPVRAYALGWFPLGARLYAKRVASQVIPLLDGHRGKEIILVGHSLGAAGAMLAATDLIYLEHRVTSVYGFEPPRCAMKGSAVAYRRVVGRLATVHRVLAMKGGYGSPIVALPPYGARFRHLGDPVVVEYSGGGPARVVTGEAAQTAWRRHKAENPLPGWRVLSRLWRRQKAHGMAGIAAALQSR